MALANKSPAERSCVILKVPPAESKLARRERTSLSLSLPPCPILEGQPVYYTVCPRNLNPVYITSYHEIETFIFFPFRASFQIPRSPFQPLPLCTCPGRYYTCYPSLPNIKFSRVFTVSSRNFFKLLLCYQQAFKFNLTLCQKYLNRNALVKVPIRI